MEPQSLLWVLALILGKWLMDALINTGVIWWFVTGLPAPSLRIPTALCLHLSEPFAFQWLRMAGAWWGWWSAWFAQTTPGWLDSERAHPDGMPAINAAQRDALLRPLLLRRTRCHLNTIASTVSPISPSQFSTG